MTEFIPNCAKNITGVFTVNQMLNYLEIISLNLVPTSSINLDMMLIRSTLRNETDCSKSIC